MRTTKSPRRVLEEAYQVGRLTLRDYSHRYSPKKFTQPQLFACLVLKEFLRLDYRKLQAVLVDSPDLAAAVGLRVIPHYTTFQKAAVRLLRSRRAERLLDVTIDRARKKGKMKRRVKLASVDGTGFETRHISAYYIKRRQKGQKHEFQTTTYTRYPYAVIACDCASHMILAVVPGRARDRMTPTSNQQSAKWLAARRLKLSWPMRDSTARRLMLSRAANTACER